MFKHSQTQACLARQVGLTVIELMLSIAIIGSLLLVGARYFKSVRSEQQITKAATMVRDIISAANSWGTANPNFKELNMDRLIAVNLLPASYTENPWGGAIMVGPTSDLYHINIKFTDVPKEGACQVLIKQFPEYSISCESKE